MKICRENPYLFEKQYKNVGHLTRRPCQRHKSPQKGCLGMKLHQALRASEEVNTLCERGKCALYVCCLRHLVSSTGAVDISDFIASIV
jgi:hypothetical protein